MKRSLFLCNTVYQVFVAIWMKRTICIDSPADIIISNHMNNGKEICDRIQKCCEFENSYYVESLKYSRRKEILTNHQDRQSRLWPNVFLRNYIKLNNQYSDVYVSNIDPFSVLLYNALTHKNPKCKIFIMEDGLATYSKLFEVHYNYNRLPDLDVLHTIIRKLFRQTGIYGNLSGIYLFNPENMRWNAPCPLHRIQPIAKEDNAFIEICNRVFAYDDSPDKYDQKYIFMEESFAADGFPINDCQLLEQLAQRVGKENIMVKIHPRNPVNRFAELGFKTNINTAIPWEVVLLNMQNVSDKVFLTVASSSVLNPLLLFNVQLKAYSLYNLIEESCKGSKLLQGEFWEAVQFVFAKYPENILMCNSIDEIQ